MSKSTVTIDGKLVAAGAAEDFQKLATAFEKKFGVTLHVRSGLRDSAEQERIFLARFKAQKTGSGPYRDVKFWKKVRYVRISSAGTVAVPGTSGHERGRDLDIYDSGTDYGVTRAGTIRSNWIKANARKYGFNPRGFTFSEPWHIESTRKAADYWKRKSPAKPAPKPKPRVKPAVGGDWLTVTSWNLGLGNAKGIAGWLKNRVAIGSRIHNDRADIVLLQEAYWTTALGHHGLAWLSANLADYRIVRHKSGRAILVRNNTRVLHTAIYAPKAKAAGHPTKYGVMAVVENLGVKSLVVNAHAQAGAKHSAVRRAWARELAGMVEASRKWHKVAAINVIIGGDWNGREAAEEFAEYGYIDAFDNAHATSAAGIKSLNSWKPKSTTGKRIDYVMIHEKRPVIKASQRNDSKVADHNRQFVRLARLPKK